MRVTSLLLVLGLLCAAASGQGYDWGAGKMAVNCWGEGESWIRVLNTGDPDYSRIWQLDVLSAVGDPVQGVAFTPDNTLYFNVVESEVVGSPPDETLQFNNGRLYRVDSVSGSTGSGANVTMVHDAAGGSYPTGPITYNPVDDKLYGADAQYMYGMDASNIAGGWTAINAGNPYSGTVALAQGYDGGLNPGRSGQPTGSATSNKVFIRNNDGIHSYDITTGAYALVVSNQDIADAGGYQSWPSVEFFGTNDAEEDLLFITGARGDAAPMLINAETGEIQSFQGAPWLEDTPRVVQLIGPANTDQKSMTQSYYGRVKSWDIHPPGTGDSARPYSSGSNWTTDWFLGENPDGNEPWWGLLWDGIFSGIWAGHHNAIAASGSDTLDAWGVETSVPGDTDGDGDVDLDDLFAVRNNFGTTSGATLADGDTDGDGDVDLDDLFAVRNNFGTGLIVPEPMMLSLLGIGALALIRRRK